MKKMLFTAPFVMFLFAAATISIAQEVDDKVCLQTVQTTCTKCHSAARICKELGEADADWTKIVKTMAGKTDIPQQTQDAVVNCLTKASDPKQFVCAK